MKVRLALSAVALVLALGAFSSSAQEATLRANIASVSDDTYPHARLVLNVEDDSLEGLPTLGVESIAITVNGRETEVVSAELASSQDEPLDLLLVMDTSGSMAGAAMASAKEAAKALLTELAPNDRVAVIRFSDDVVVVQDFTADRALVTAAIDGLVAEGNTALYQATTVAAFKAVSSTATRKAVVLLSDGADFGGASTATRAEAVTAATNVGVPYFAIAQGSDLDLPYLQELAYVSKGRLLEAVNPADLASLYLSIGRLLRNQYIVRFDASAAATLPESTVAVTVTAGERAATDEAAYQPAPGFAPVVDISGVDPGDEVNDARDVLVNIGGVVPAARVTFFVDDTQVAESITGPFVFTYDPRNFPEGEHTLRVVVDLGGQPVEASVPITSVLPAAPTDGGGGLPIVPIAIVVLVGLVAIGGGGAFLRFRHSGSDIGRISVSQRTIPWAQQVAQKREAPEMPLLRVDEEAVEPESIGEPLGLLISRSGSDLGSEYTVGGAPVSMGSAARCGVRIADPELSAEEARIWVRGGHLMVHKMTRLSVIAADGTSGGWMILEPGDTFTISEHVFEFRMLEQAQRDGAGGAGEPVVMIDPGPVPNILRERSADEPGQFGTDTEQKLRLTEMMPSSELAPSASYDDDQDDDV